MCVHGHAPSFGERSDVLVCWFAEQVCAEFHFRPVHTLSEVHTYRPERRVPARKMDDGEVGRLREEGFDALSGLGLDLVAYWFS